MGFRGMLLERRQSAGAGFQMLSPSVELVLVIERMESSDIDPSGICDAKVVLQDATTKQLHSVARLADVTLEAGSMFWHADDEAVHCFRFDATFAFGEVSRAVDSVRLQEQLALLQHGLDLTVSSEHYTTCASVMATVLQETSKEKDTKKRTRDDKPERTRKRTAAPDDRIRAENRAYNLKWIVSTKASSGSAQKVCHLCQLWQCRMFYCPSGAAGHEVCIDCIEQHFHESLPDFMSGSVRYHCRLCADECPCGPCQPPQATGACVVCAAHSDLDAHPSVLQDKSGRQLFLCAPCLQTLRTSQLSKRPFCTLCGVHGASARRCGTCWRDFCAPCQARMGTLRGGVGKWLCASCALPSAEATAIRSRTKAKGVVLVDPTDAVTYTVSYAQQLVAREAKKKAPVISEDSCFCCKDGGVLIECDHTTKSKGGVRCPKVYHKDCLNHPIPDKGTWRCPRHFCFKCSAASSVCCRFCAMAYCDKHVPRSAQIIGPAFLDLPGATYMVCSSCEEQFDEATARQLLPDAYYRATK
ncbi:hypothetical protein ACHHYP_16919 [Achlya hypogyna]|uniref:Uncharacterized protein n=1 Tax=Achlya hypogyna TaxID=1202772 RepID=A0A1V9ZDU6_ACHHY|nr:hypothetical protein ACHHYP_16919 [Achlya hypogyna]